MVQIYALCVGYLELDRASMLSDLTLGTPWTSAGVELSGSASTGSPAL